jgi:hypothetical protein
MEGRDVAMPDGFLPPRMGGDPSDGQVHLDEAFGVGGGHVDDFRKSVDDWFDDSVDSTESSVGCRSISGFDLTIQRFHVTII